MATAKRMGLETIALHTPVDAGALFTRLADRTVEVPSYLDAQAIVAAAKAAGAQCLHPGYGFLSENADFAEYCAIEDIVFVGPPPEAMRAMGLKSSAKALVARTGAPVVPGYYGENQTAKFMKERAYQLGYPVLIKAIAGGGGRGIRRVDSHIEFEAALESAQREAEAAFGDGRVLIEKLIASPRHIEVQVFGDSARPCRASLRARLLAAAAAAKADRGDAGAGPARADPRRDDGGRGRRGQGGRLCRGGDGRVHRRRQQGSGARTASISWR